MTAAKGVDNEKPLDNESSDDMKSKSSPALPLGNLCPIDGLHHGGNAMALNKSICRVTGARPSHGREVALG